MQDAPARADLVFRDATLIDGSGADRVSGDLAVAGDRIVAIGDLGRTAGTDEIDARGLVLCPGFIDAHTHDDRALVETPDMSPKISQGVTSVVAGNCGISLAPLTLDTWPPDPLHLLGDQTYYRFDTFGGFVAHFGAAPAAVNAGLLVGHTTLRHRHMTGRLDRPANDAELARMETDVAAAMAEGAIGLSTGLDYAEAVEAPTEEVTALAQAAGRRGGIYASHTRDYFDDVEGAIDEAIGIAREARLPLVLSHHQVSGAANFGRSKRTLALIDDAMTRQEIGLDVYPYNASSKTLDPQRCQPGVRVLITWSDSQPAMAGREIADIAAEWGCNAVEAAKRLVPAGAVYFQLDEADVQRILAYPRTMIGSDGLPYDAFPHPRLWGTFPRVLGHYARDLNLFTLEEAVHRMTGLPAATFGFADRGLLRIGSHADLVLFDPDTIRDRATYTDPKQPADGIHSVFVNGEAVWQAGRETGARPGRVLHRTS